MAQYFAVFTIFSWHYLHTSHVTNDSCVQYNTSIVALMPYNLSIFEFVDISVLVKKIVIFCKYVHPWTSERQLEYPQWVNKMRLTKIQEEALCRDRVCFCQVTVACIGCRLPGCDYGLNTTLIETAYIVSWWFDRIHGVYDWQMARKYTTFDSRPARRPAIKRYRWLFC